MAVGVHKAGQQQAAAAVHDLIRPFRFRARTQGRDAAPLHRQPSVFAIRHMFVHGKKPGIFQQCFHVASFSRSSTAAQNTATLRPITFSSRSKDTVCWALGIGVIMRM